MDSESCSVKHIKTTVLEFRCLWVVLLTNSPNWEFLNKNNLSFDASSFSWRSVILLFSISRNRSRVEKTSHICYRRIRKVVDGSASYCKLFDNTTKDTRRGKLGFNRNRTQLRERQWSSELACDTLLGRSPMRDHLGRYRFRRHGGGTECALLWNSHTVIASEVIHNSIVRRHFGSIRFR